MQTGGVNLREQKWSLHVINFQVKGWSFKFLLEPQAIKLLQNDICKPVDLTYGVHIYQDS